MVLRPALPRKSDAVLKELVSGLAGHAAMVGRMLLRKDVVLRVRHQAQDVASAVGDASDVRSKARAASSSRFVPGA